LRVGERQAGEKYNKKEGGIRGAAKRRERRRGDERRR